MAPYLMKRARIAWVVAGLVWPLVPNGSVRGEEAPTLEFLFAVTEAERGSALRKPSAIASDPSRGEVYVCDSGRREILVYSEEGEFLQAMGPARGVDHPIRIAFDPAGRLVAGRADRAEIQILERSGNEVATFAPGLANEVAIHPGGLAVEPDGAILVAERFGEIVLRLDPVTGEGRRVGPGGSHAGSPVELQDVIVTRDGDVVLLSSRGSAVRVLDRLGNPATHFGEHGSRFDQFSFPMAVAEAPDGALWIVDCFQHGIKVFRPDGSFVEHLGEMGAADGRFFFPVDLAFGSGGRVFVVEKGTARVQAFRTGPPARGGDE